MRGGRAAPIAATALLLAAPVALPLPAANALAQTRPLATEDPRPVPAGLAVVEAGVTALVDEAFPLSGLEGTLVELPVATFRFGFGRAELAVSSGYQRLWIDERRPAPFADALDFDGDAVGDIVDPVVATKVVLWHETARQPAVSVRFATKLPSAANRKGLGTDATDFFLALLAGKSLGPLRATANFGMGVLSIPEDGQRQNDVLVYGLAVARRVGERLEVVAEVAGREDVKGDAPAGTEDRGRALLGARWQVGEWRIDAGVLTGLHRDDPAFGATVGLSRGFAAFGGEAGP